VHQINTPQASGKQPCGIIVVYLKISAVIALTKRNEDNGEGMWSDEDASPVILND
jgi:hypothetical protein